MERLTFVCEDGTVLFHPAELPENEGVTITNLAEYERYYELEQIAQQLANCEQYCEHLEKELAEYKRLEEQGTLIRLPCKCDTVVFVAEKGFPTHKALYSCPSAMLDDIEHGAGIGYTREEAEKALERMEGNAEAINCKTKEK